MWDQLKRAYGQFDKNVAQGYLPGGAARQKNPTEMILSGVASSPLVDMPRQALNLAGKVSPQIAPVADASENAIRAVTGDNRSRAPQSFNPGTRDLLADAIDRSIASSGAKPGQTVDVQYQDYAKDGNPDNKGLGAYTAGAFNGGRNADGSYFIDKNEMYDFNAAGQGADYKKNLDQATQAAWDRGDYAAWIANLPDHLGYHTGAGKKGYNIGGDFARSDSPAPQQTVAQQPVPQQPVPRMASQADITVDNTAPPGPAMNYAVQAGDTLTDIARANNTTVAEIAKKNNIANVDMIGIGQQLKF